MGEFSKIVLLIKIVLSGHSTTECSLVHHKKYDVKKIFNSSIYSFFVLLYGAPNILTFIAVYAINVNTGTEYEVMI